MPRAVELRHGTLARQSRPPKCILPWHPSRRFLRGLLLGAHAFDVRRGRGQYRLHARAGRRHGCREEHVLGKENEPALGNHSCRLGRADSAQSFFVLTKGSKIWNPKVLCINLKPSAMAPGSPKPTVSTKKSFSSLCETRECLWRACAIRLLPPACTIFWSTMTFRK